MDYVMHDPSEFILALIVLVSVVYITLKKLKASHLYMEARERAKHVKNMLKFTYYALTENHKDFSYVICRGFYMQYTQTYGIRGERDPYKDRL